MDYVVKKTELVVDSPKGKNFIHPVIDGEKNDYFPIIENNVIYLSLSHRLLYKDIDINQLGYAYFDIIIKETKEKVGNISFDYSCNYGFTYSGNVSYSIAEPFRNKHYATMALGLLKQLLVYNEYSDNKDIYVATLPDNEFSQKVAVNNGGNLYYDGAVPKTDSVYYIDGVREVKVYRIEI